jgi:type III pantothenate kinase
MDAQPHKYFVVDAGNTRIKLACFQNNQLDFVKSLNYDQLSDLKEWTNQIQPIATLIAGVVNEDRLASIASYCKSAFMFDRNHPLPINFSNYLTFQSLGVDRIANATAAAHYSSGASLVIDVGTCIKYDLVDAQKNYHGGAISPGVPMRFRALHDYTDKLPLLTDYDKVTPLTGTTTIQSIMSGVMNGAIGEMTHFIEQYTQQFPQLTIFLTGGDAILFDNALKSSIFVDQNFTLKGLFLILKHHASR